MMTVGVICELDQCSFKLVFREGARVKNRVTPLIDNNKHTHPLDEQQV
jgi:hypothetical protein